MIKRRFILKKLIFALLLTIISITILLTAFDDRLETTIYTIHSDKVQKPVKIVLLTDLHSCVFGKHQKDLLDIIKAQNPDVILMTGDIVDDVMPLDGVLDLLDGLSGLYPCYYVSGNHELWKSDIAEIKEILRGYGVIVLEGDCVIDTFNGQSINICGVDDPYYGMKTFDTQLDNAFANIDTSLYTILLAHRPEFIDQYTAYDCDLVLSGHAHGGQFRIPFILNGIYSPGQGFFPKYTSGIYEQDGVKLLVGRGLSKESTRLPRIYNRPELVVIKLLPNNVLSN